jgi:hypothetical protein
MTKVVYNGCYGGFSLSKLACQRYFELQGKQVWIEDDREFSSFGCFTVWLVPPEERVKVKKTKEFSKMTMDERIAYNRKMSEQTWYDRGVSRHDPFLVQVVEELGEKANGQYAKLYIAEVDGPYRISEYAGSESVKTPDSCDWITP